VVLTRGPLYYVKAIRDLRDHIYAERYTPEVAARQAPRVIYAAACLLKNAPYQDISNPADYLREQYIGQSFMPLKYLKRIDPLAYALTMEADKILHGWLNINPRQVAWWNYSSNDLPGIYLYHV
jgi:hypothetical protein